jgi:cytochrome oxidase Cu insertion factor (SCO1/SenC/PrrC family)
MNFLVRSLLILFFLLFSPMTSVQGSDDKIGGDFQLKDHRDQPFELNQLEGKLVMLFFGYTYCPDICPTELASLAAVFDALGDQAERVQGLFVSLDPARDTPEVLANYVSYFHPAVMGLTGSQAEIERVAQQYRVSYQRHERADGSYSLDHSANLYLINAQGELAAVVPYGLPPEHVFEMVRGILAEEPLDPRHQTADIHN